MITVLVPLDHRESVGSPGYFLLVEAWESEEAFDAGQRSEAFRAAVGALENYIAGPPVIGQFSGSLQLAAA